jgi:glioma pathogenesis-related protein 2
METLQHHNTLRAHHCVDAMVLNATLNRLAQNFAEWLAAHNRFEHSKSSYGENLYWGSSSAGLTNIKGNVAVQSWYDEIKDYDFNNSTFSMATGHFTQVVWKASKQLGVGIAFANSGRAAYVVANYGPAGNVQGQFAEHVLRATC